MISEPPQDDTPWPTSQEDYGSGDLVEVKRDEMIKPRKAIPRSRDGEAARFTSASEITEPLAGTKRPSITYQDSELPYMVNRACEAAMDAGAPLYGRGIGLFRPVKISAPPEPEPGKIARADGATILVPVDDTALTEILTSVINWQRYNDRKNEHRSISCPQVIAKTTIARKGEWPFHQLKAVIFAPTMRQDGTILNEPGFDVRTGILFASDLIWPKVPDRPPMADARAALKLLNGLVGSFPFVDASDRSASLAMILTALVRPRLPAAPMFGISAPTPGTGKSKLANITSALAVGHDASVLPAPREEEELKKHIGSVFMDGDPILVIDNVDHPIRSEFLCQVLTQSSVSVRVLGESRKLNLPTAATFCATGNSLRFVGDLTRRVVLINLDARMERPEERVFKTDASATAILRRVEYVTAGLTLLRAFVVQRGAKIVPALGGFEIWSDLVRSALMWLGEADPLGNANKVRENDTERERTSAVLAALATLPAREPWTASGIGRMIEMDLGRDPNYREHEALADALSDFLERNGRLNSTRFGHFLRKHVGRIVDGKRIIQCGKDRSNVALWSVEDGSTPTLEPF